MKTGQRIHIQAQDEEYGRIASDGTIAEVFDYGMLLVDVDSVRARIVISKKEARII